MPRTMKALLLAVVPGVLTTTNASPAASLRGAAPASLQVRVCYCLAYGYVDPGSTDSFAY